MDNMYILAIVSTAISAILTPFVRKFAVRFNVIDVPKDHRRVHNKPTPLLGGLAIYFSFVITLILCKGALTNSEIGLIIGATIIVIGGVIDDKYNIRPWKKLLFQISAALVLIFFGVSINVITNPISNIYEFINIGYLCIPLTIIWIVGITNAVNLIDGLDGLAAGISLIASITLFIISILNSRNEAATLIIIFSGAILGFLPYNFNPATIFMGDTGSQLLGFMLAGISIRGAIKSAVAFSIAVPILALGIPIYDTLFAMIRRKINGKPIMAPDRGHLHHRLLDMGLTQKQVVAIMYIISAILGTFSIIAMEINPQKSYFVLLAVMIVLILIAWRAGFFKHKE
jgi:UDP-GlcNAc:undecaprenyl-phosphate/decaprenyl-phosphate GlcNAc-1-phosphate transferase